MPIKKILITGSSGRVGRSLHWKLSQEYHTIGLDIAHSSSTSLIGDIRDQSILKEAMQNVDVVYHTAALHAPHVGHNSNELFYDINVEATRNLCEIALAVGVKQIIFTSTTALYGYANQGVDQASWINEETQPLPRTIYHRTKIEAENVLRDYAGDKLKVRVIRMSRCFPEPVQQMAIYRLHRGVDYRDVADAHILAAKNESLNDYEDFIISGATPFLQEDVFGLACKPEAVIRNRCPLLADEYDKRKWSFPTKIDRVYYASKAMRLLGWQPKFGFMSVINQFDNEDFEVLP